MRDYHTANRLGEWKSNDAGQFTKKERLSNDFLTHRDDIKKRVPISKPTLMEAHKQASKDVKFPFAGCHSLKNRRVFEKIEELILKYHLEI